MQMQELLTSSFPPLRIPPAVNHIEVHPFNTRSAITTFCTAHDIIVEAYAPLARALRMTHPTITALAAKYSVAPAQLMIRWSLQHGFVPLPKSVTRDRIWVNGRVGGWVIEERDMVALDGLDEYLVTDWDPVGCE